MNNLGCGVVYHVEILWLFLVVNLLLTFIFFRNPTIAIFSDNDYIHVYDFILIVTKNPHGIIVGVSNSADRVVIPTNCSDAGVGLLTVLWWLDVPRLRVFWGTSAYLDSFVYDLLAHHFFVPDILQEVPVNLEAFYMVGFSSDSGDWYRKSAFLTVFVILLTRLSNF